MTRFFFSLDNIQISKNTIVTCEILVYTV